MSDLSAANLRAQGINHHRAHDDEDLVDSVAILLARGVTVDEVAHLGFAKALSARSIRPNPHKGADADRALAAIGVDDAFSQQVRRAMGFRKGSGMGITEDEVAATHLFASLRDLIGEEETLSVVRVVGSSAARIARAITALLRVNFEPPIDSSPARLSAAIEAYADLIDASLPAFLDATVALVRRHLAAVLADDQNWQVDETRSATFQELAIGFADLVGFTAFTEAADAKQFMTVMVRFEREVQDAVVDNGGIVVKLIGDEVMFATPDAVTAVKVADRLVAIGRYIAGLEGMRVGLAYGRVITSGGDYYGTVVNTAARIVAQAYPDAIVATGAAVEHLPASVDTTSLGAHQLRGIAAPVELYRVRP